MKTIHIHIHHAPVRDATRWEVVTLRTGESVLGRAGSPTVFANLSDAQSVAAAFGKGAEAYKSPLMNRFLVRVPSGRSG